METIESMIKKQLYLHQMSMKDFCAQIDISEVALRNIFKRNDCKVSLLKKIGEVFNVPLCGIICDETNSENEYTEEILRLKTEIGYLKEINELKSKISKLPQ